ncbi:MAG: FAD:protein FMN transferase, partial [Sulfurimonadaceae bacterium]
EKSKEQQKSFEILRSVERSLSSYGPQADIYRLNHERSSMISPYTYEALLLSKRYYQESDGYFDITVGSITKELYRFGEETRIASKRELKNAKVDFKGLHFDTEKAWLDKGTIIDLGGMGKGFGVDKVALYLKEQNITEGKVALSGDIRCLDICKMAIQNPFGEGNMAEFITKQPNTAISTSGNYRRFVESKRDNHLIDPKQKESQQLFASITLLSHGTNSDIDAYATAASVMPLEKAITFLDGLNVGYVLITNSGERYINDNIERFTENLHFTKEVKFTCETPPE